MIALLGAVGFAVVGFFALEGVEKAINFRLSMRRTEDQQRRVDEQDPDLRLNPVGGRSAVLEVLNNGGYAKFLVRGRILPKSTCNPKTKHKYDIFRQHIKKRDTAIVELASYGSTGHVWICTSSPPSRLLEGFPTSYQRGLRLFLDVEIQTITEEMSPPLCRAVYQIDAVPASQQLEITDVTESYGPTN